MFTNQINFFIDNIPQINMEKTSYRDEKLSVRLRLKFPQRNVSMYNW